MTPATATGTAARTVQPGPWSDPAYAIDAGMTLGGSSRWLSLFQLHDGDDGLALGVDRKADRVARLERLQERRGADFVAHRHRLHKALDFAVLDDQLLAGGDHRDDGALATDGLRQEASMERRVHIGQHVPALVFRQDRFKGRHRRLHGFERLDLTALAHPPEEVRVAVTR